MNTIFSLVIISMICAVSFRVCDFIVSRLLRQRNSFNVYITDNNIEYTNLEKSFANEYLPVLKTPEKDREIHSITKNISGHIAFAKKEVKDNIKQQEVRIYNSETTYYTILFQSEKEYIRFMMQVLKK